ncbi:cyclin-like F-box [Purpureocillium lavendulum]|uniref:Cyclin-like F-box n=1 Tax=Purpureocillium lavendulum TaxID=1247861 RepID=A0AB34FQ74_9HYPO|nr:cyclin-like F-box [Purpureocillium lavendulum]
MADLATQPQRYSNHRYETFPVLPAHRPRSLSFTAPSPAATSTSAFFKRLPPEIRRAILIEAFGADTIHLDLRPYYPSWSMTSRTDPSWRIQWEWDAKVCHRPRLPWRTLPASVRDMLDPSMDGCHGNVHMDCQYAPAGKPGNECRVGAVGWLRTCRKAYLEGVEVLYGTNRMNMEWWILWRPLPGVLPRAHLDAIVDVELRWDMSFDLLTTPMRVMVEVGQEHEVRLGEFHSALKTIPTTLPSLRYMLLSVSAAHIQNISVAFRDYLFEVGDSVLEAVDSVASALSQLVELRVALPDNCYLSRKTRANAAHDASAAAGEAWHANVEAIWRRLPTTTTTGGTLEELGVGRGVQGYWVCGGSHNLRQH